ncbi:hypothetical protein HMPREF1239_1275 [Streptococcus pyogenes GA03805]|nr:hypothetical protein HMPREF1239_1275 [Streptococcus pyogenes GA03805]
MKFEKKQVFYLVLTFILCYGILANWRNGTAIVTTIYKTSLPFFMEQQVPILLIL